ncbi:unnamed protein product [Prorocentrum cordatum]|uniref:Pentacotripeptide-repeat region of PRORP domain-containing protein n=1 Tax=Prorocentrum cordatum TaxID=2364126 RepID=A0ABN9PY09_9DINO|nr:unnamed protein product [Polarella glacialis]
MVLARQVGGPGFVHTPSSPRQEGAYTDGGPCLAWALPGSAAPGCTSRRPPKVDTTAYNCVLEVCAVSGDLPEARKLLRRMEGTGHVDVVSYNTYPADIKALLASGAVDEAEAALEEMRRRSLAPNTVTYNSLVKGAIAAKDAERAWQLVADMEQVGVQPDAFTCSILVKGAKHAPQACDVDRVIALMKRASVVPDEVLINCLLDTCVRIRDVHRLSQVLDQFRATGVVPSPHAHATLLRAYGHAQRPEQAWALWRELTSPSGAQPIEEPEPAYLS